jgi:hypothetical protein
MMEDGNLQHGTLHLQMRRQHVDTFANSSCPLLLNGRSESSSENPTGPAAVPPRCGIENIPLACVSLIVPPQSPLSCELIMTERKAKRMALDKIRKLALWDPLPPFFALLVQPVDDNGREDPEWRCSVGDLEEGSPAWSGDECLPSVAPVLSSAVSRTKSLHLMPMPLLGR